MPAIDLGMPDSARQLHHEQVAGLHEGTLASVHSWELVTAVDGPGTRMTLFLDGCPLRCQYCQNPDTWRLHDGVITPIDDIMGRIHRYRDLFDATGGGLTVSGGEPLMQSSFVERLFERCHTDGIRTALDTSGFLGRNASDALLDTTDLVLLDVKSGMPDTYREVTGRELAPTVEFGDRLSRRGNRIWIRFVLVPGLTDDPANVDAIAEIVRGWNTVERVEVLPFHQMGKNKWARLGVPYRLHDTRPPDSRLLQRVHAQFRSHGLTVF